ncbi:dihydrofolate reductase [Paracoccus sp. Z330]|uniref:Dihydrofolate reductase n=2 Tax=Paracoccus onchidii TaxID=3017813 RepID=A0ABT4ZBJ0_9RHOB|nr:dihydrofolate reductase [Paracoccus onchidii]MDB6176652.1 dihydrofolate reductase [Paracoccus onchidii]
MLTLIAAQDRNGAIGRDNTIPWHIPEDFAYFKAQTTGGAVIMGRKTWDSLPKRPLPNRLNIVVSRQPLDLGPEIAVVELDGAISHAESRGYKNIYCIGGEQIYRQMLCRADRILLSTVETEIQDADAFFPEIPSDHWTKGQSKILRHDAPRCSVTEYHRVTADAAP